MSKNEIGPQRIIRLEVENFKRLRAVEIEPDGTYVEVRGRNAQGKTSLMDAIEYALGGTRGAPTMPVRDGEDSARILCELTDFTVTRTFTAAGGTAIRVTSKDGRRYPSPQSILDGFIGKLSFDPLAFARQKSSLRMETVRELAGVDVSELDAERLRVFDERTDTNRDGKRLRAQHDGMSEVMDAPAELVSVSDLAAELEAAAAAGDAQAERRRVADDSLEEVKGFVLDVEQLKQQLEMAEKRHSASEKRNKEAVDDLAAHTGTVPDLAPIRARLATVEETNAGVRSNQRREALGKELETARAESQKQTDRLTAIDAEKREIIAAAKLPVEGLSWDETGVTLNGLPFDQASSAEQLRASVAMAMAANPSLCVLLVRDGSLLDEDGLRLIAEMAAEAGAQVWLERVGEGDGAGIVIEDGMIKVDADGGAL